MKTLCSGMIRNAMCLRLLRGCSKLISILLVSKIIIGEEKKRAWKSYHEKLLNTEFAWGKNNLSQEDTIASIPCSTYEDMVSESKSKIISVRKGKNSRSSRNSEDIVNKIIVDRRS